MGGAPAKTHHRAGTKICGSTEAAYEAALTQALEAIKERQLREQLSKQAQRTATKARADAREEADAAVVQHLSASQPDLGAAVTPVEKPVQAERLVPGVKIRVRGFPSPVVLRRIDGRGADVEAGLSADENCAG